MGSEANNELVELIPGTIISAEQRRANGWIPYLGSESHIGIHDFGSWHPDNARDLLKEEKKMKKQGVGSTRLPFEKRILSDGRTVEAKSRFYARTALAELIARSAEYPAVVAANRYLVVMFDAGFVVGFDATRGRDTSMISVVMKQDGHVITAHPGVADVGSALFPLSKGVLAR